MYAKVLIEYKVKTLDRVWTYKIPESLNIMVGNKVLVPFGKMILNGIVLEISNKSDVDTKEIIDVIDQDIVLSDELLELGKKISEDTVSSLMSVYQAMMPSSLKIKSNNSNYQLYKELIVLNKDKSIIEEYINTNKRSKVQNEILNKLLNGKLLYKKDVSLSSLKKLIELGLVKITKEKIYRINVFSYNSKKCILTKEQNNVVESVEMNSCNTYLLHGITGSGKTEVYMSLIEKVLNNRKTALVLVPEISLTTQIVNRFYLRFGKNVAILHSALSQGEKFDEYKKIINRDVKIVVGTRSAVFAPLKNIGIIIIDEEHTSSYKQENNPRYNAIDAGIFRAEYNNCPIVLGSATPTLESYARALKGVYKLLVLDKRIGDSILPKVTMIDMADEIKKRNFIIGAQLKDAILERLERKEQIMLLLNRRGFSTFINCQSCGYTYKCPHCDISLTYHKVSNHLRCHYCGYTLFKSDVCPSCKEKSIRDFGLGTEKLEEEIKKLFPKARVVRMDADTTIKKGSHERIIKSIENREYDIIIGTQMISKGLDFPYVTLVGVINADESLNIPDFRSGERTFSLLCQVAGRAGRSELKGDVIIQTFNPDNITLNLAAHQDYKGLFNYEMNLRKRLKYPPYYYLTSIKICSRNYDDAIENAKKISLYLKNNLSDEIILGPTTAGMFKLNGIFRFQIIIKYKNFDNIKKHLKYIDDLYINERQVYLEIDNNPLRI